MQFLTSLTVLASAVTGAMAASRPMNTSICDYYTTALLKDNTPANQYKLLQLVVNTAVIGNYTMPNVGIKVPGILAQGTYMGQSVNLAPYFNGALQSSNRNGKAVSINFLDGGGAKPLMANTLPPMSSNQYTLLTHLYEYFGGLLMCSGLGQMGYPAYNGQGSQYQVHRFMALNSSQVGYFIQQVGMSAASFGVTNDDVMAVGQALTKTFDYKCAPPAVVIPSQGAQLQSICIANDCMQSPNASCSAYPNNNAVQMPAMTPGGASAAMNGTGSSSSGGSMTSSGSPSSTTAGTKATVSAAAGNVAGVGAAAAAAAVFAFAL